MRLWERLRCDKVGGVGRIGVRGIWGSGWRGSGEQGIRDSKMGNSIDEGEGRWVFFDGLGENGLYRRKNRESGSGRARVFWHFERVDWGLADVWTWVFLGFERIWCLVTMF